MSEQKNYKIIPIEEKHIDAFREAVGAVAKEGRFLALMDTPSIEQVRTFITEQLRNKMPHYIAVVGDTSLSNDDAARQPRRSVQLAHETMANNDRSVVWEGCKIVGWCDIASFNRPAFAHSGVLRMGIRKEYRGIGLGKKLMQIVLDKGREMGMTRVELDVREDNESAIKLYEKFGFVVEGLKRNACKTEGIYSNVLVMGLLFDENGQKNEL
jgi:ribosomal protein S18 acetylase RimI-like enzyme